MPRLALRISIFIAAMVALAFLLLSEGSRAQKGTSQSDAGARIGDAGFVGDAGSSDADAAAEVEIPEEVRELKRRARQIRSLLTGELDVEVKPQSLFELPLDDSAALRVEAERLRGVLLHAEALGEALDAGKLPDAAGIKLPDAGALADSGPSDAGVSEAGPPEGDGGVDAEPSSLDPERWLAQLELDRARLAFLGLAPQRRALILDAHRERQAASQSDTNKQKLSAAEEKARQAEQERLDAIATAKQARTEALRLVAEERARLLGVAQAQAQFETELLKRDQRLELARERALELRRKLEKVLAPPVDIDPEDADALYEDVRLRLEDARQALAEAASSFADSGIDVPAPGADPLRDVLGEVNVQPVRELRDRLQVAAAKLREAQLELLRLEAKVFDRSVAQLNAYRLRLLKHLSEDKREAVTGFGPVGREHAFDEARQVWLVLRYHLIATADWLASIRAPGDARGDSALTATFLALKWLVPILAFVAWRRRAQPTLDRLQEDLGEARRKAGGGPTPTRVERAIRLVSRVRRPAEWLLLTWAVIALLPDEAARLLEVQIVQTILFWTFGGSLVVGVVDYLADASSTRRLRRSRLNTRELRLRSLRLAGRLVVIFGLVLALTSQLVGKGTIFSWVITLCWVASVPLLLVLVKWWRPVILERIRGKRRKNAVESWAARYDAGWRSFLAALAGGASLLITGLWRRLRHWITGFNASRRVLAYLFSREITKRADATARSQLRPLEPEVFEQLGPEVASKEIVPSVADAQVEQVIARINRTGGGVFAIVGERGAGKTTLLKRISESVKEARRMRCPYGGMSHFAPAFLQAVGADAEESLEDAVKQLDATETETAILVDDAHRLILPMMGGLKAFDRVLAIARHNSENAAWVFAFDDVIWRFFERMRGAQPLFDDVVRIKRWGEPATMRLLVERSKQVGITPVFEHLVGELPADVDEQEREDAIERTEVAYYRLIWDHSLGNPGVALNTWREVLGMDAQGRHVVQVFRPHSMEELEGLPDSAVFVLRALVQLERANVEQIQKATGISAREVEDALRFGSVRGFFDRSDGSYQVKWNWFRTITRFLRRRHLLF